jgi:WD40 repeat protein
VLLWRTTDWSRAAALAGHTQGVRALKWNGDGSALFSAGIDRTIRAWDPTSKAYGGVRGRYGENNYSVSFSRDGKLLACSSADRTIGAVDAATGAEAFRFQTRHEREACTAAMSPDGRWIASCSWDKSFRVYDLASKAEIAKVDLPAGAAYFAWSPDGARVALALIDKSAVIVSAHDWSVERTFAGHGGKVNTVAWSTEGTKVLTGSADGSARVWTVGSGECAAVMKPARDSASGHAGPIESAVFVPTTNLVATASHDGSVRIWDATTGDIARVLMVSSDALYRIAASPDGKRLAVGGRYLYLLDPMAEQPLVRERPLQDTIWHLDWSPDGSHLAIGSWNGEIVVFGASTRPTP